MGPISIMIKPASGLCNMSCTYCFYKDEMSIRENEQYGMMSLETLETIVKKGLKKAEGHITFAFQGGEPTLRGLPFFHSLIEFEKKYNDRHIEIHHAFQTNGYLLDENWAKYFKENNFLVGISIDGIQSIHDLYRLDNKGQPTYQRIVEKTKILDQYQVDYNILTVVNKDVASHIQEIYIEYKKRGWQYMQFIPCLDELESKRGLREYSLTPKLYGEFLVKLFKLWYKDAKRRKQPYIRTFENYVGILLGYPPESCDMFGRCGISYIVEANGDVYPCDFYMLDAYRLGNFNTDRFIDLDEKRKEIQFVERSLNLSPKCKSCKYLRICRGGCQRHREVQNDAYLNYFCESYQHFFDECLDDFHDLIHMLQNQRR